MKYIWAPARAFQPKVTWRWHPKAKLQAAHHWIDCLPLFPLGCILNLSRNMYYIHIITCQHLEIDLRVLNRVTVHVVDQIVVSIHPLGIQASSWESRRIMALRRLRPSTMRDLRIDVRPKAILVSVPVRRNSQGHVRIPGWRQKAQWWCHIKLTFRTKRFCDSRFQVPHRAKRQFRQYFW